MNVLCDADSGDENRYLYTMELTSSIFRNTSRSGIHATNPEFLTTLLLSLPSALCIVFLNERKTKGLTILILTYLLNFERFLLTKFTKIQL